jgi:uncharacterized protein YyaL (SSP411 family)
VSADHGAAPAPDPIPGAVPGHDPSAVAPHQGELVDGGPPPAGELLQHERGRGRDDGRASKGPRRANRLAGETSPYLLQHAHNPVDWRPWGEEALEVARAEDKPIFLSVGYAACHWCHVMERESFEDEVTAAQLNRDFVPIKVDREERPDLDQLYMGAVVAMTGQGGWPMSVFLTPEGRPFYGGTYFPGEPRHGMPSFRQVLEGVRRAWDEQRPELEQAATRLVSAISDQQRAEASASLPDRATLEGAVTALEAGFDAVHGGWGGAPKFPAAMTIDWLMRRWLSGDARAISMARRTLDRMADGGIFDQLGGGFHRYSIDGIWLVPHFEKMLYDNAQLARVYLHAWQVSGDAQYLAVATATLDYILRELTTADGAFAASQDADTGGVEGATFTWSADEIADALRAGDAGEDIELFSSAYGVTTEGNWEGRTILSRVRSTAAIAGSTGLAAHEVEARLARDRAILLEARSRRPQPARDDKALAAWNGLAIAALAEAARALARAADAEAIERAAIYLTAAERAATIIVERLGDGTGRLRRSWKDGRASAPGVLEDHADLADGLLALYQATFDERWFVEARRLADVILARFGDPAGGFFDTASDHETLVARPKDLQDNAVPSGNAMAATVLLKVAALTGAARYRAAADAALRLSTPYLARYPSAFSQWLIAAELAIGPVVEVAIVGDPADPATVRLLEPAFARFQPGLVIAAGREHRPSAVPLLQGRFALGGRPTAFVCRHFACRQPVNEPEALAALLLTEEAAR